MTLILVTVGAGYIGHTCKTLKLAGFDSANGGRWRSANSPTFSGPLFTKDTALYAPLVLMANDNMCRVLLVVAVLIAGIFPSCAQRGPAYPSDSIRGPAFPKSVGPSEKNQTNWVTGPQDNTPTDTYQQLWILQRRWDQLYGSPNSPAWRRLDD